MPRRIIATQTNAVGRGYTVGRAKYPNNWPRIERNIKLRADFRCECGTGYDCGSNTHLSRCPSIDGQRYAHNKRLIKLRVVQIRRGEDWRPHNLVALCLPCYVLWAKEEEAEIQRELGPALW
jgi:hypothetical protein